MQGHSSMSLKNNATGTAPDSGTVGNGDLQNLCYEREKEIEASLKKEHRR